MKAGALLLIMALFAFSFPGCSGDSGTDSGGSAITSEELAKDVMRAVYRTAQGVNDQLNNGTYQSQTVGGSSGTASVTGERSYEQGASSNTAWSTYDCEITIVFDSYVSGTVTLDGTMYYSHYYHSTQYGSGSFSSTTNVHIESDGLEVSLNNHDAYYFDASTINVKDKISFSGYDVNDLEDKLSISMTTSSGQTYSFSDWL